MFPGRTVPGERMIRLLTVAAALVAGSSARADDYYLTIFAAESVPYRPVKTHTFVAATRIPSDGTAVENYEIGWLAATTHVRGFALRPEAGHNFSVLETIAICRRENMRVSVWGPYRIQPELFCRLRDLAILLDSGTIKYKGTDSFYKSTVAMNCYHAIWSVTNPPRKYAGPFTAGDTTGGKTVHLFRQWIICPEQTHDEILKVIGVDQECLVRRTYDYWPTRFDAMRSAVGR
jgi:hypothetical protein